MSIVENIHYCIEELITDLEHCEHVVQFLIDQDISNVIGAKNLYEHYRVRLNNINKVVQGFENDFDTGDEKYDLLYKKAAEIAKRIFMYINAFETGK